MYQKGGAIKVKGKVLKVHGSRCWERVGHDPESPVPVSRGPLLFTHYYLLSLTGLPMMSAIDFWSASNL
jgi:hypothetical protein